MAAGSTPSSFWLRLCQWGLIKFWSARLGPQFENQTHGAPLSFASGVLWPKNLEGLDCLWKSIYKLHT